MVSKSSIFFISLALCLSFNPAWARITTTASSENKTEDHTLKNTNDKRALLVAPTSSPTRADPTAGPTLWKFPGTMPPCPDFPCILPLPTPPPTSLPTSGTKAPKVEKGTKAPKVEKGTKAPKVEKGTKAPKGAKDTKAPKGAKNTKAPKAESTKALKVKSIQTAAPTTTAPTSTPNLTPSPTEDPTEAPSIQPTICVETTGYRFTISIGSKDCEWITRKPARIDRFCFGAFEVDQNGDLIRENCPIACGICYVGYDDDEGNVFD